MADLHPASSSESSSASPDFILITPSPLEGYNPQQLVSHPGAGGISVFLGVTRNQCDGRRVLHLEYESYHSMAVQQLSLLCAEMRALWPQLLRIAILHRIGVVSLGSCSVLISVSSAHRRDCQEAVSFCIDQLKRTVPIWKKERYDDGDTSWKQNAEVDIPQLIKQTTDVILEHVSDADSQQQQQQQAQGAEHS
jgi:molybdopterin synthase catalytic subunit